MTATERVGAHAATNAIAATAPRRSSKRFLRNWGHSHYTASGRPDCLRYKPPVNRLGCYEIDYTVTRVRDDAVRRRRVGSR